MDNGITIYALYKTTVLQNQLTESLPLCTEIKHTTYYLWLPIPLNFAPLVNACCWSLSDTTTNIWYEQDIKKQAKKHNKIFCFLLFVFLFLFWGFFWLGYLGGYFCLCLFCFLILVNSHAQNQMFKFPAAQVYIPPLRRARICKSRTMKYFPCLVFTSLEVTKTYSCLEWIWNFNL